MPRHPSVSPMELSLWTSHNEAVPGDQLEIHCGSRDGQTAEFNIRVGGRPVRGRRTSDKLEARLALTQQHFTSARRRSGRRDWEDLVRCSPTCLMSHEDLRLCFGATLTETLPSKVPTDEL